MFMIYWIVPNAQLKFKAVIPGAVFATTGWMLLSQVLEFMLVILQRV